MLHGAAKQIEQTSLIDLSVNTASKLVKRLYDIANSENLQNSAELASLAAKIKRENFFLYDISGASDVDDPLDEQWNRYRDSIKLNVLPLLIRFATQHANSLHDAFNFISKKLNEQSKKYDTKGNGKIEDEIADIICENTIDTAENNHENLLQSLNSPNIWKFLLDNQLFDLFIYFMARYIDKMLCFFTLYIFFCSNVFA